MKEITALQTILVIVGEAGLKAIPWAHRIASLSGGPLSILCPGKDALTRFQEVSKVDADTPAIMGSILEATSKDGDHPARVYDCRARSTYRGVLDGARELDARL